MPTLPSQKAPLTPQTNRPVSGGDVRAVGGFGASLLEALPDGVLAMDRTWRITFANAEARRISRLNEADLNARTHWEIYPETVGTEVERVYREVMETGESAHLEYFHAPFDIWYDVTVLAMPDGIALHYRDVSEMKRAETARDASARRLKQVMEATTDAVVSLDREWTYNFLNDRAARLLGRDDLLGRNLWEEFPAALEERFAAQYRRCMEDRVPTEFDAYYPAPLDRWFFLLCRPSEDGMVVFFRDITERRKTEQTAKEQRELITFVQQASRTAFWNLNLRTRKLTFDEGSYPIFGQPLEKLRTIEDFRPILHPDDRECVAAGYRRAIETGELTVIDFRTVDEAGEAVWLEARLQASMVEGVAVSVGGLAIDITERKRNEEALSASEERYRVLTELSPQFLWTGSPGGEITYANQGLLDYLGLTAGQLDGRVDGRQWLDAFDEADREYVALEWRRSTGDGKIFDREARLIEGSTGASRWWWLRGLPLRDEAGAITNWLGVAVDIHERKTATDALEQKQMETERQRAEIETLYRTAPVALAEFDPVEFRYLRLNNRQAEIVGLPREEIVGRRVSEIAPLPALEAIFHEAAEGRVTRNAIVEGEIPSQPGQHRFWSVNCSPVFGADGTVRAVTAASMEVTAQKRAEAALIQSEKLAAVGRLASSISHEINNPLEAVTNLLYLIANDPELPESLHPLAESAQSELARVCQIVTQTLRFHRQAVRPTEVTAEELVGSVLNLYRGRLMNSGIAVEATYKTQTRLLCLENDIRQVLNNLIANAIDAMRQGGRLIVRAHESTNYWAGYEARDGCRSGRRGLRIIIADTGYGMPAGVAARIYEPFYTTKELNGTGLGLWISAGIVDRHGGRLQVRSRAGAASHGTVFSMFLPWMAEEIAPAELLEQSRP